MIQIKLALKEMTDLQIVDFTKVVGTKLTSNSNFTAPPVVGTILTADANALDTLFQARAALESQLQQLTLQIRTARDKCETDLGLDAAYVEQTINTPPPPATTVDPVVAAAKAKSAGMDVVGARTPVGPMPKVEGLRVTQGDSNGSVDLQWNPVKRGLASYLVECTSDPADQAGWHGAASPTKSSVTVPGLTSGSRCWFRVAANGAADPGPWSEVATKIVP